MNAPSAAWLERQVLLEGYGSTWGVLDRLGPGFQSAHATFRCAFVLLRPDLLSSAQCCCEVLSDVFPSVPRGACLLGLER